jgi:hypothetical protein
MAVKTLLILILIIILQACSNSGVITPCTCHIDSISVDESNDRLVLHGLFDDPNNTQVKVDDKNLSTTYLSDSLIYATIPVSGKGSAGKVKVIVSNSESNQKLLSYLHFFVSHSYLYNSTHRGEKNYNRDTIHIRTDFEHISQETYPISSSKLSRCHDYDQFTNRDSSGQLNTFVIFDTKSKILLYNIKYRSYFGEETATSTIDLDNNFTPVAKDESDGYCGQSGGTCFRWGPIQMTDFPR